MHILQNCILGLGQYSVEPLHLHRTRLDLAAVSIFMIHLLEQTSEMNKLGPTLEARWRSPRQNSAKFETSWRWPQQFCDYCKRILVAEIILNLFKMLHTSMSHARKEKKDFLETPFMIAFCQLVADQ